MQAANVSLQQAADLLVHKRTHFALWRPAVTDPAPELVIGIFAPGDPPTLANAQTFPLSPSAKGSDLWDIAARDCLLENGKVYHYWFKVTDSNLYKESHPRILCTDPFATSVDWRLMGPRPDDPAFGEEDRYPASVVLYKNGELLPCDPDGQQPDWRNDTPLEQLPVNTQLVIYELPTAWARTRKEGGIMVAGGTFRDVLALVDPAAVPFSFFGLAVLQEGRAHLRDLGITALELLPPADSFVRGGWGYSTTNYLAADHDLGLYGRDRKSAPMTELARLIRACHQMGIRFFADMVMAFSARNPYRSINFPDFFVKADSGDPEEYSNGVRRDGFGSDLFKYHYEVETYDPFSGEKQKLVPANAFMVTYLDHWMRFYRIDGVRIDSIVNIASWDFIQHFKNIGHRIYQERWSAQGHNPDEAGARYLVTGEELAMPLDLIHQQRIDSLWNEYFKRYVRAAILGQNHPNEQNFEDTVKKMVDCRLLGYGDGSQAINYVTSHDVEGYGNERLYDFLENSGIAEKEQRIKLAFSCLITSVGVPMIFAGEEFADQHDVPAEGPDKQLDAVNFERRDDPWRARIVDHVTRLVHLRTYYEALWTNDTTFIHSDFSEDKRVMAWVRGQPGSRDMVVIVANFSDYMTPNARDKRSEYVINNWPQLPEGMRWYEVTQDRTVSVRWAGREPIFPWEAKVYAAV
ncbi:alpha-amylase family glycosyl hydrolase [Dictyobacter aurantiacus]|uniref:Alpha-glucanotransferase n=1 Tax=Dictyobacter aurantiacus TaxID=1936993 RepID=A0A401ZPY2_9CHLR|nr:alpha-amylase family glycosyl hydrolase [Dictyobacter aurantiacus]GCE08844.1 alpha-glucanotransferase [Dictyobacter aurantiacus]